MSYNLNLNDTVCVTIKDNNQTINGIIKSLSVKQDGNFKVGTCAIELEDVIKIYPATEAVITKDGVETNGVIIDYAKNILTVTGVNLGK